MYKHGGAGAHSACGQRWSGSQGQLLQRRVRCFQVVSGRADYWKQKEAEAGERVFQKYKGDPRGSEKAPMSLLQILIFFPV